MLQAELITVFIDPLNRVALPYMITGAVAAIYYGEPRLTHDIDIVVQITASDVELFCTCFSVDGYYCPPPDIIQIEIKRKSFAHFNLIHHDSGLKADCYPAGHDELHRWGLEHRKKVVIDTKRTFWLAPAEYVIIRKLQYFREGGSEKHIEDIAHMLRVSSKQVDFTFLEKYITLYRLDEEWKKIKRG